MTWHAQHAEDFKIHELLGYVEGFKPMPETGFYIDIGAWDPDVDSVTKFFYENCWNGINVEPVPFYHEKLTTARPRDVNLQIAISETIGEKTFTHIKGTGLSTFHPEYSKQFGHQYGVEVFPVVTLTLRRLCEIFVPKNIEIDFLKIDVEGWEREVLIGGDWNKYRPKVLCIEATVPGTDTPAWDTWDYLLTDSFRYDFIEFDGLNRYYKRREGWVNP